MVRIGEHEVRPHLRRDTRGVGTTAGFEVVLGQAHLAAQPVESCPRAHHRCSRVAIEVLEFHDGSGEIAEASARHGRALVHAKPRLALVSEHRCQQSQRLAKASLREPQLCLELVQQLPVTGNPRGSVLPQQPLGVIEPSRRQVDEREALAMDGRIAEAGREDWIERDPPFLPPVGLRGRKHPVPVG